MTMTERRRGSSTALHVTCVAYELMVLRSKFPGDVDVCTVVRMLHRGSHRWRLEPVCTRDVLLIRERYGQRGLYIFGRSNEPSHDASWIVREPQEVSQLVSKELQRAHEVFGSLRVAPREVSQVS